MTGAELIAQERERQIAVEGYTPEHDQEHDDELLMAAHGYLVAGRWGYDTTEPVIWPWGPTAWKPSADPIRNLVKAGALIAAEIDRLHNV